MAVSAIRWNSRNLLRILIVKIIFMVYMHTLPALEECWNYSHLRWSLYFHVDKYILCVQTTQLTEQKTRRRISRLLGWKDLPFLWQQFESSSALHFDNIQSCGLLYFGCCVVLILGMRNEKWRRMRQSRSGGWWRPGAKLAARKIWKIISRKKAKRTPNSNKRRGEKMKLKSASRREPMLCRCFLENTFMKH